MSGGMWAYTYTTGVSRDAGFAVLVFAPIVLTSAIALAFLQGLMALRRFRAAATVTLTALTLAAACCILLIPILGIAGLAVADLAGNMVCIMLSVWLLNRQERSVL
jgi:O-antigen/teichoic acid export membrane protein